MNGLTSFFWRGDVLGSRGVSDMVLSGTVDVPAVPAQLMADWRRDMAQSLALEPGDVEALPLARSRARGRWPDYRCCVKAAVDWTDRIGLPDVLASSDIALMACRGARYHHDGVQYGDMAFCNLFLSEAEGLDLHLPIAGVRIPLVRGTVVVFDTGQPHAVIPRGSSRFDAADFSRGQHDAQIFLTWELPVDNRHVSQALQLVFDIDTSTAQHLNAQQVLLHGRAVSVCPESGGWCPTE